jgi:uracil-DNA glycosylase family 4
VWNQTIATKERNVTDVSQMTIEQLEAAIRACTLCALHKGRTQAVPGEGPANADIMFIGEGPGFHEDRQGRPFVGAAGQFLEELLASINLTREQVYIANVVKCRPPGNRDPLPEELSACAPYLDRQIELIRPKVIVTLGRFSMARFFPGASISKIHGQPKRVGNVLVVPMFHPAAALHQPKWRPVVEADFKRLPGFIAEAASFGEQEPPPQAQQLSLF